MAGKVHCSGLKSVLRAWSTSALSPASAEYRTQPKNVETATQCARDCPRLEEGAPQPQLLPPQPSGKRQGKRSLNSPRSICSQARIIICSVHARAPSTPTLSTFHTEVRRSPCLCAAGQATSPYGRSLRSHPPGLHLPFWSLAFCPGPHQPVRRGLYYPPTRWIRTHRTNWDLQAPNDTHSNPVPGCACAQVMQHNG